MTPEGHNDLLPLLEQHLRVADRPSPATTCTTCPKYELLRPRRTGSRTILASCSARGYLAAHGWIQASPSMGERAGRTSGARR